MYLNFRELIELNFELNGFANNDGNVVIQGLRRQKLTLETKIFLDRLNKQASSEMKSYEEQRMELYKKYGTQEGESITINKENLIDFNKEHEELLNVGAMIDTELCWGKKDIFELIKGIETTEDYPVFYKLIGQ